MPISQGVALKALASAIVGGRVDSQGRLMLQHADGTETVSGKVAGTDGQPGSPGTPGKDATAAMVEQAAASWLAAHPSTQVALNIDVPATTITLGSQVRDVAVTWAKPWPDTNYEAVAFVVAGVVLLGKVTPLAAKSKTTTGCVVPVDIAATLTAGQVKLHVLGLRS